PVAAHPPILSAAVRAEIRGIVFYQLDVRDETCPCKHALDEVMAQQRVRRKPPLERFAERVDLVDAFARETALAEQILIHVRDRPCVDVETDVPGVETGETAPRRRPRA